MTIWNRRSWLQWNAALMGTFAAMPATNVLPKAFALDDDVASPATNASMRLGLVTYLWGQHLDLTTLLQTCEASGLSGVELRTEHAHRVEPELTTHERDEVRKQFEDSPVTLVGYGSNCEFHTTDPKKLAANITRCKEYILLMHELGGTGVKVKPNAFPKEVSRERTIEQIGLSLRQVGEFGADHGQQIRVEVHGEGTSELPVIQRIMEVADHPNVKVCWNCNPEDLIGDGLEANFQSVRSYFGDTVHVRELDSKDYPYDKLFALLKKTDYKAWVLLEARTNPTDIGAALMNQKQWFDTLTG